MKKLIAVAFLMLACGGGASGGGVIDEPLPPEPAPCTPAPLGFVAWQSTDGVVHVSKKLTGTSPGGIENHAEIHNLAPESLPATVDFRPEQIEVRQDLSLCLVDG